MIAPVKFRTLHLPRSRAILVDVSGRRRAPTFLSSRSTSTRASRSSHMSLTFLLRAPALTATSPPRRSRPAALPSPQPTAHPVLARRRTADRSRSCRRSAERKHAPATVYAGARGRAGCRPRRRRRSRLSRHRVYEACGGHSLAVAPQVVVCEPALSSQVPAAQQLAWHVRRATRRQARGRRARCRRHRERRRHHCCCTAGTCQLGACVYLSRCCVPLRVF